MFAQFRSTSYNHIPTIWKESLSFSLQGPHRYNFGSCEIESPKKERKYQGLVCLNPLLEAVQFGTENWSEKTKNKSFKSKNETSILIETRLYLESILYRKTESTDTFWARGFSWINNNSMVGLNSDLYRLCGSLHGLHTFWARGLSWINQETTTTTITTGLDWVSWRSEKQTKHSGEFSARAGWSKTPHADTGNSAGRNWHYLCSIVLTGQGNLSVIGTFLIRLLPVPDIRG